jgi:hypothetical protein
MIEAFKGPKPELVTRAAPNSGVKSLKTPAPIRPPGMPERLNTSGYGANHSPFGSSVEPGATVESGFLDTDPVMRSVQTLGTGGKGDGNQNTQTRKIDSSTPGVPVHSAMHSPSKASDKVPGSLQSDFAASPSIDSYRK